VGSSQQLTPTWKMGEIRILTREKKKGRQMDKQTKKKVRERMRKRKRREGERRKDSTS
jgi:hypothetical protein